MRDYCRKGKLKSTDYGLGWNLKIGLLFPISKSVDLETEYKYTTLKINIDSLRSGADMKADFSGQTLTAGLRYKF